MHCHRNYLHLIWTHKMNRTRRQILWKGGASILFGILARKAVAEAKLSDLAAHASPVRIPLEKMRSLLRLGMTSEELKAIFSQEKYEYYYFRAGQNETPDDEQYRLSGVSLSGRYYAISPSVVWDQGQVVTTSHVRVACYMDKNDETIRIDLNVRVETVETRSLDSRGGIYPQK